MPRVLVVANRLPVTADRDGDEWSLKVSSGGLASAFSGVQHFQIQWIGWPGVSVGDEVGRETLTRALAAEDHSLDFNTLCALYAIADVALITSVQDGMDLVSHEFVACQDARNVVLVLNQFAGSAQALKGAVLIDPSNTMEVVEGIKRALAMPLNERKKRHEDNLQYVTTHTGQIWAERFVRGAVTAKRVNNIGKVTFVMPMESI